MTQISESAGARDGSATTESEPHDDIIYPGMIPFLVVHLACIGAIWTGVSATGITLLIVLYLVRMFAVTAGYHRYFSHRSFKTSRVGQFVLAFLAQSSAQKGCLWWAAKHRQHHKYSDTPLDSHSPRQRGFWFAQLGWVFSKKDGEADYDLVSDLSRYPELVWLNKNQHVPPLCLAVACLGFFGWEGLFVGFFMSTVLLYHCTFFINSLAHVIGRQRYTTGDDSRNNWWLALITLGEGWHNNHHRYHTSTRQGFFWWEIDITFYVLKMLSYCRLVWGLRAPPAHLLAAGEPQIGESVLNRISRQLVDTYHLDSIAEQVVAAWNSKPTVEELRQGTKKKLSELQALLSEIHLPQVPSMEDLRKRAAELFSETPSLDQIVERARQLILEELSQRLIDRDGEAGVVPA